MTDTQALHTMLQDHLRLIETNQAELRRVEAELDQAVAAKAEKLSVTENCMRTRTQRPTQEKVRDDVETLLEEEYSGLEQAIQELKQAKRKVQEQQRRFAALKQQLQLDLRDKRQALDLDMNTVKFRSTVPPGQAFVNRP